jgi:O-antigen/teichoic acid export membrane protein
VLRLLAIGVLINAVGQILFAFVQGRGRPDLTAKLHLIELPIYILLIVFFLPLWGIEGAALAWTCRVVLDTALLWLVADRISAPRSTPRALIGGVGVSALAILAVGWLVVGLAAKVLVSFFAVAVFAILFWKVALDTMDREYLGQLKHRILRSNRR